MQRKPINLNRPSEYYKIICEAFAKACYETNKDKYVERNHLDPSKSLKDIYNGKMCEFAVFEYLLLSGKKVSSPDIAIYPYKYKSYDADLIVEGNNLHVKSCVENDSYENSWLFEPNDCLVYKPSELDYMAFVYITKRGSYKCFFTSAKDVVTLYKPTRNPAFNKKAIYQSDLESNNLI